MSTEKEETLGVKSFRGVNRFADGTVTSPSEFFTLQNMHPISQGELAAISGIVSQAASVPGVGSFVSTRFYTDPFGVSKLLGFFIPNTVQASLIPAVDATNFSGVPPGADAVDFLVTYVGPGGLVGSTKVTLTMVDLFTIRTGAQDFTFTLPLVIDSAIAQIDVYCDTQYGAFGFCGSFHRRIGASVGFVASAQLHFPLMINPAVGSTASKFFPAVARCYSGSAAKTKKIYVGLAPAVAQVSGSDDVRQSRVVMVNNEAPAQFLAVDVPDTGTAEVEICLPYSSPGHTGSPVTGGLEVYHWLPFWGITPEDLQLAYSSAVGVATPVSAHFAQYSFVSGSAGSDTLTLNPVLGSETIQDGDQIVWVGSGVTGLVNGNVYYIRNVSGFSRGGQVIVRFYSSQANFIANSYVDITGFAAPAGSVFLTKVIFSVQDPIVNSRNGVQMVQDYVQKNDAPLIPGPTLSGSTTYSAIASRTEGAFRNMAIVPPNPLGGTDVGHWENGFSIVDSFTSPGSPDLLQALGCWVFDVLPFNMNAAYQLLPNINERAYVHSTLVSLNAAPDKMLAPSYFMKPSIRAMDFDLNDDTVSTTQFFQRMFMANGDNQLMYTNGFVWKSAMADDGKAPIPSGKYVQAFAERLVNGGGRESVVTSPNNVYFSNPDTPFDWGTTINTLNVFSREPMNGFGAFSQNLLDASFSAFLVISKRDSLFIWDGKSSDGAQQIYSKFGFAGPRAFAVSNFGPMFVSRDNIYSFQGDRIIPIGDEFRNDIRALTDVQLQRITMEYHLNIMKIAYPSGAGAAPEADREIWVELRLEGGGLQKYWSGPHLLTASGDQSATISYNGSRDVRASYSTNTIFQRDSGSTDNANPIPRLLINNRLGLQQEHVWKLIQRIYSAVKIAQDENFTITLNGEDGSSTYTSTMAVLFANGARQLAQWFVANRFRGRIVSLQIANTSSQPISIFDLSLLFKTLRRRTLR